MKTNGIEVDGRKYQVRLSPDFTRAEKFPLNLVVICETKRERTNSKGRTVIDQHQVFDHRDEAPYENGRLTCVSCGKPYKVIAMHLPPRPGPKPNPKNGTVQLSRMKPTLVEIGKWSPSYSRKSSSRETAHS